MEHRQAIPSPTGITVFGSSLLRVLPDIALLNLAAHGLHEAPAEAFALVRSKAEAVTSFLRGAAVAEVACSRVTLKQEFRYTAGEQRFVGYLARVGFQILLRDLEQVEDVLVGAISAGANEVVSVELQTSALREHRIDARKRAVHSAREKALAYCDAANTTLGAVIHIEDVNPEILTGVHEGHVHRQVSPEDAGGFGAFDPGAISVGAAVMVVYALSDPDRVSR